MRNDISNLLDFIKQDDLWFGRLQDVTTEHLMPALEEFDLDYDDLPELLGEPWPSVLWGCGFEDFLSRRDDEGSVVDLYIKRRGWNETAANREYFAALRDTPVRLYEVSNVKPGESMVLKDLVGDRGPVTVFEKSATRSLKQWDRIAVRVIAEGNTHVISGALLAFSAEAVDFLFEGLRAALKLKGNAPLQLTKHQLMNCAPVFTTAWLFTTLPNTMSPGLPELCNSDGDDVMFHDLRFRLAPGVLQKEIAACLDDVKGFVPEGPRFWNWLATRKTPKKGSGMMWDTELTGRTVLGSLELKGKYLLVQVNSAARAEKIEALVVEATGKRLKRPLTAIRTVGQVMSDERAESSLEDADEVPPHIEKKITHDYMDKHYRETLDAPLPALDGKSPRQAVRSAAGRAKVVDWLKLLENRSDKQQNAALAEYDFGWMWAELDLQEYRK